MKPVHAYFLRGQGGTVTSGGLDRLADQIRMWPFATVKEFDWGEWPQVVTDVDQHAAEDIVRLGVGYSMGANAFTWVLSGVSLGGVSAPGITKTKFDCIALIDPTWLSAISQLTPKTVSRVLHFKNTSLDPVGHGTVIADSGVLMQVVNTYESHLTVDYDKAVQQNILNAFMAARS